MNFARLSFGGRLTVTLLLINVLLGLVFGQIAVRYALSEKDGEPGISLGDVRLFFQGDPTRCRLQTMLTGKMHDKLTSVEDRQTIDDWIADGAPRETYDTAIAPIFAARCVKCHGPGGEKATSPLTAFDDVSRHVTSSDTGVSYEGLADVSWLNLIVLTCFTTLVAGLFSFTRFSGAWKEWLMAVAYAAVFVHILSWWSAKQSDMYLHVIIATAVVFAVSIAAMALLTLADLWTTVQEEEQG
jgi:hypothetical protein